VSREFRDVIEAAGLGPKKCTPRELRHSFVSLLSADRVAIEHIAAWRATAAQASRRRSTGSRSCLSCRGGDSDGPDLPRSAKEPPQEASGAV
jgi:hypothetical protein